MSSQSCAPLRVVCNGQSSNLSVSFPLFHPIHSDDALSAFIEECVLIVPGQSVAVESMYEFFTVWWEQSVSRQPWPLDKFKEQMRQRVAYMEIDTNQWFIGVCMKGEMEVEI